MDEFYNDWILNENYWFNCSKETDKYLVLKYEYLLDEEINQNIPIIGYIILYDQLPRHIYRNTLSNHIIEYYLNKSLIIVNNYKTNRLFINNLTDIEWIFFMLPLRHTNIKSNIIYVIKEFPQRFITCNNKMILKKFIIATLKNCKYEEKLKKRISYFYDNSILEYKPCKETIYKKGIKDFNLNENIKTGIISLSGGVDSMVCLHNCILLYPNIEWKCVHINYNNRIESNNEVRFLGYYCYKNNIKLYVRDIDEVSREFYKKNDLREIYELYTKKIRYNSYKFKNNNPIVILGHNKDDCFENILTNISNNSKQENLKGMKYESEIENIVFIRPLINISKEEIYKYAQENNIPYLKNSTPKWSQRGKIRNNIMPVLNEWNNNIINGIYNISDVLENLYNFMNIYVENVINKTKNNILVLKLNELNFNKIFWKLYIFKLLNIIPSNKSLDYFINRLLLWYNKQLETIKHLQIVIKKNLIFEIQNNKENLIIKFNYLQL